MYNRYDISDALAGDQEFLNEISEDFAQGLAALGHIAPAVTIYGSARVLPGDPVYRQAEELARLLGLQGFAVATGGGPGVMEAANRGARQAGAVSIGINVRFPTEQPDNSQATVAIRVRHMFVRKILLLKCAQAVVFLPGGYGTLDELFETLALIQTERLRPLPVLLFGSWYWAPLLSWVQETLVAKGFVSPEDSAMMRVVDTIDDVVQQVGPASRAPGTWLESSPP